METTEKDWEADEANTEKEKRGGKGKKKRARRKGAARRQEVGRGIETEMSQGGRKSSWEIRRARTSDSGLG